MGLLQQQQRANQEAGSTADRGNGWKDMKLAEKCWAYADARRGILRQRKERHYQGAKKGARNGRIKMRIGIKVMEICCWKERRNRPERVKARTGSKAGSGKRSRQGERMEKHVIGIEVLWTYADARRSILRQRKERHHQGASRKRKRTD